MRSFAVCVFCVSFEVINCTCTSVVLSHSVGPTKWLLSQTTDLITDDATSLLRPIVQKNNGLNGSSRNGRSVVHRRNHAVSRRNDGVATAHAHAHAGEASGAEAQGRDDTARTRHDGSSLPPPPLPPRRPAYAAARAPSPPRRRPHGRALHSPSYTHTHRHVLRAARLFYSPQTDPGYVRATCVRDAVMSRPPRPDASGKSTNRFSVAASRGEARARAGCGGRVVSVAAVAARGRRYPLCSARPARLPPGAKGEAPGSRAPRDRIGRARLARPFGAFRCVRFPSRHSYPPRAQG